MILSRGCLQMSITISLRICRFSCCGPCFLIVYSAGLGHSVPRSLLHCFWAVCAGPAGIHFAKRLKDEGYAASDITILESQNHLGGKSFTYFLPEQPHVRHEVRQPTLFSFSME